MFEIVFIIIFIWAIYRRVKRVQENEGSIKGNNSMPNTTVTTRNSSEAQGFPRQDTPAQPKPRSRSAQQRSLQQRSAQTMQGGTPARSAIQEAREDGNSTTAYLMEKAEADAREHAKEKFEEQKRLHETRGGLPVAERYLDGDTVPQGKKCINCGYCGAENLIPMIPRTRYSCYFCREPL